MGVAGALAKFGVKAAAKIGLGAAAGSALPGPGTVGGAAVGIGLAALDIIPLLQDLASNGSDPEKIAKVKAMRDSMAQKLVESKGIPMDQALAEVNEQMKPLIDDASKSEGRGPGGTLLDAASIAGGAFLAKKAGLFGRGKKALGAAETAAAKELAPVEAATRASTGHREYVGAAGERRAAEEAAARSGAMDSVTGDRPSRLPATIPAREAREPEVMDRGFMQVPADGGTAPMDDDELKQMMIAALLRRQPQRPPGMQPRPAISAP